MKTVEVVPGADLGRAAAVSDGRAVILTLFAATLADSMLADGEPGVGPEHDELRWLAADELTGVPWLPIDAGLLPAVRSMLQL